MLLKKLLGKNKSVNIKFILIEIILVTIGAPPYKPRQSLITLANP